MGRGLCSSLDILLLTKFSFLMLQECPEKGESLRSELSKPKMPLQSCRYDLQMEQQHLEATTILEPTVKFYMVKGSDG